MAILAFCINMTKKVIYNVEKILLNDLRDCFKGPGILASPVNFSDYWARDSFWTAIGVLEAGPPPTPLLNEEGEPLNVYPFLLNQIRSSIELFAKYQNKNGKIPRKICLDYNALKYYFKVRVKRKNPRPIYTSPIKFLFSFDDNLLFVIAFCKYIEVTQDTEFAKKYFPIVEKALTFYKKKSLIQSDLLYEKGLANWQDTIFKRGYVLYTNALWYEAVRRFEEIKQKDQLVTNCHFDRSGVPMSGANRDGAEWRNPCRGVRKDLEIPSSQQIRKQIQQKFWISQKEYFADSVSRKSKKQEYFDLAGNVLTLLFGIAEKEQVDKVLDKIMTLKSKEEKLHRLNDPLYPWWKISPAAYFVGIRDYQNGISWSWIEALTMVVLFKYRRIDQGEENLKDFSEVILKNGHVHETYYPDGRPYDHRFWKSAVPFAWGAGLMLWAVKYSK